MSRIRATIGSVTNAHEAEMQVPEAFREEYETFLTETGFDNPDPQELLMELASLSMEVYLKEICWLSDFIGKVSQKSHRAA
ncbi:hypothetical protein ABVF61_22145 [Roseibium sp. HPY-6]|uniref:hypothetical protein n=1 Tax=Roseibium sp. HPY-6 TaxID=3229852 RepID=UPI00338E93B0